MGDRIDKIIEQVAADMGITKFKTTKVIENLFNFLKNSMGKLEYEEYYITKFGKFNIIKKRLEKKVAKNKQKLTKNEEKTDEKQSNDQG